MLKPHAEGPLWRGRMSIARTAAPGRVLDGRRQLETFRRIADIPDSLLIRAVHPQVCGTAALPNITLGAAVGCNPRWFDAINHCPVLLAGACLPHLRFLLPRVLLVSVGVSAPLCLTDTTESYNATPMTAMKLDWTGLSYDAPTSIPLFSKK